jgi:DNA repair protein RadA/Sms
VSKSREIFVCRACGSAQARWLGRCPDCGGWDTLEAEQVARGEKHDPQRALVSAWAAVGEGDGAVALAPAAALPIEQVPAGESQTRVSTGVGELDRVLGGKWPIASSESQAPEGQTRGGLVPGSAVLIGGSPGIGKSTLLLQAAAAMGRRGTRVLYVSSEESASQVRMRAERIGGGASAGAGDAAPGASEAGRPWGGDLYLLSETNLSRIVEQARKVMPAVLVIDSIQMIYKADLPAAPGSITQLRRCAADLVHLAKLSGMAVVMVGHVTKEGQLAGPRLLEHLVDAVLSFEGDRYHAHRLVRAVKNRFGATHEIGIFEMTGGGLREVPEGAGVPALALDGRARPGSVVCPVMSGTRCVLVEVQALTATGFLGAAKRRSSGIDSNRLAMLIAVLEQHAEMRLADRDVFASAVGGVRVVEPASDLALLLAIAGAQMRRALGPGTAAAGEVGLGGEIRPVSQLEQRAREAARLGYRRLVAPGPFPPHLVKRAGIELIPVRTVNEAAAVLERAAEVRS